MQDSLNLRNQKEGFDQTRLEQIDKFLNEEQYFIHKQTDISTMKIISEKLILLFNNY